MIYIRKNNQNNVHLTLNEKSYFYRINVQPYFLFVLQNDGVLDQVKIFTAPDGSTIPDRYNKFSFTERQNENLLNGVIHLTGNTSQWNYEVYESDTPFSADTLSISATTGFILEKGRVFVDGNDNTINDIYK